MKRYLLILSAIALVGLLSCSKERTCKCTTTYTDANGNEVMAPVEQTTTVEGKCATLDIEQTAGGITQKMTCVNE